MGLIINARIKRVVYAEPYTSDTHQDKGGEWAQEAAKAAGIDMLPLVEKVKVSWD
jgi:deoxycytidylate deaminase